MTRRVDCMVGKRRTGVGALFFTHQAAFLARQFPRGAALVLVAGAAVWKLRSLDASRKKRFIKWTVRAFYQRLEDWGVIEPTPAYIGDYHRQYPGLEALEKLLSMGQPECDFVDAARAAIAKARGEK